MVFKFCSHLPPLVSLLNGNCSFWHSSRVTQWLRFSASNRSCNVRQRDSASGSLRAFLLALDMEKQTHLPYVPQPENKLNAINLFISRLLLCSKLSSLWFSSLPQRSLASRLPQESILMPGSLSWALMPVRCFHSIHPMDCFSHYFIGSCFWIHFL